MGQRENHVEIGHGQQFCGAVGEPLRARCPLALGTMPVPAGVLRDDTMTAPIALLHVTAENGRRAVLEGMQDPEVDQVQQLALGFDKLLSVTTDDIGHLVGWPPAHGSV
jgi:hypothetical protein